jgi:hypothetical protein
MSIGPCGRAILVFAGYSFLGLSAPAAAADLPRCGHIVIDSPGDYFWLFCQVNGGHRW